MCFDKLPDGSFGLTDTPVHGAEELFRQRAANSARELNEDVPERHFAAPNSWGGTFASCVERAAVSDDLERIVSVWKSLAAQR